LAASAANFYLRNPRIDLSKNQRPFAEYLRGILAAGIAILAALPKKSVAILNNPRSPVIGLAVRVCAATTSQEAIAINKTLLRGFTGLCSMATS